MADSRSLTTISEADYDAIESAVMETERGRWFLKEFTRRNRNADTQVLLEAIGRLEQVVAGERVAQDADRLRANLREMATAIARTKTDIASIHAPEQEHTRLFEASEALDAITRTTEQATSDILAAAEHVQECAWTLREGGADPQLCDELDRRATEIYTACSFQDITAQRIVKIVQTLRYLEGRIHAMISTWDKAEASLSPEEMRAQRTPAPEPAVDLDQDDVDTMIVGADPFEQPPMPAHASGAPVAPPLIEVEPDDLTFAECETETPAQAQDAPAVVEPHGAEDEPGAPALAADAPASFRTGAAQPSGLLERIEVEPDDLTFAMSEAENSPVADSEHPVEDEHAPGTPTDCMSDAEAAAAAEEAAAATEEGGPVFPAETELAPSLRLEAFAEIDRMPTREKLRAFT